MNETVFVKIICKTGFNSALSTFHFKVHKELKESVSKNLIKNEESDIDKVRIVIGDSIILENAYNKAL